MYIHAVIAYFDRDGFLAGETLWELCSGRFPLSDLPSFECDEFIDCELSLLGSSSERLDSLIS